MEKLEVQGETIYTTAVNIAELFHGAHRAKNKEKALSDIKKIVDKFHILNLDYESGKVWGELADKLKSDILGDLDLFIASIALVNKQTLITRNVKHFERVPGLTVESW